MIDSLPALGVFAALALGPSVAVAQSIGPAPAPAPGPGPGAAPPPARKGPPPTASPTTPREQPPPTQPTQPTTPTPPAETAPTQPAPVQPTPAPAQPTSPSGGGGASNTIDDAAWEALQGRQVVVETASGPLEGELLRSDGDTLVMVYEDGEVLTVPKADALSVRVAKGGPGTPATSPQPSPAEQMADLETSPAPEPGPAADEAPGESEPAAEGEEELTAAQKRRKERREKREHALLGAFMMHGATYTHWRGDGVQAGHASYAMDWGVGINPSAGFGMYAMAGGLLGAKIRNEGERIKANYGHVAFVFAFSRKYFFSTVGAGVAFSRLRYGSDDRLEKDRGLAIPTRLVGKIPLPHDLYLGLGITYELGLVRGFSRAVNGIGGQIVLGRW